MTDLVIGSGPSGVAVASALLARGRQVLMLDGGRTLEAHRAAARDALAAQAPEGWKQADRAAWQAPQYATPAGQVRRYGSDFAMMPAADTFAEVPGDFALRATLAAGGLSNLWGSAVLLYRAADMAGWPVTETDLAPHYRAVADFMPVSGRQDDLQGLFPVFPMQGRTGLDPSPQGGVLLDRFSRAKVGLAAAGMVAGQSRQAVASGCRGCGMCLHGCPWGLIWSARSMVEKLRGHPGFSYRAGAIVTTFAETVKGVTLTLAGGETLSGSRAFIAAGVLGTARILLASQPTRQSLILRDSQHGFLPTLHGWRPPCRPDRGAFHTLPQAFLELDDRAISPFLIHSQIYSWNEFYERDLIASYGHRLPGSAPLWRALARRLIVAQIFLHSDHSAHVTLGLGRGGNLTAKAERNPQTHLVFTAAATAIARGLRMAGLAPLTFARRMGPVGSSFHAGATVPMQSAPSPQGSDIFGRPSGLARVHLVDASVLPAIPATTITFPVMANAHRIGACAE
jgi:choline dehydrogenase-like flavoprotein